MWPKSVHFSSSFIQKIHLCKNISKLLNNLFFYRIKHLLFWIKISYSWPACISAFKSNSYKLANRNLNVMFNNKFFHISSSTGISYQLCNFVFLAMPLHWFQSVPRKTCYWQLINDCYHKQEITQKTQVRLRNYHTQSHLLF